MADPEDPKNPEAWFGEPNVCGSCVAWKPEGTAEEDDVAIGLCRLRPEMRRVPANLGKCPKYNQRGGFTYRPQPTREPSRRRRAAAAVVKRRNDAGELVDVTPPPKPRSPRAPRAKLPSRSDVEASRATGEALAYVPPPPPRYRPFPEREGRPASVDVGDATAPLVHAAVAELFAELVPGRRRDLHSKFRQGGTVTVTDAEGRSRTVPAHRFFSWLERLAKTVDVLEEALDTHEKLADEAEELLGHVRRIRGTFTTFNLLFADRQDYFTGKL
ncbi:MAG: hypothetical protein AAFZ18_09880 [Myxococcota bacterium]